MNLSEYILAKADQQDLEAVSSRSQNLQQKLTFNVLCAEEKVAELVPEPVG